MVSFLQSLDLGLLRWINQGWSNSFLDGFFSFITELKNFVIPVLFLIFYLLIKGGEKGRWVVGTLLLCILITDQTSSHLIKSLVERVRPCNALPDILTPHGKSSAFSFPSSHATNMGGSMLLLGLAYRPWMGVTLTIAFLAGLSRIYLGLHYPSDVLFGWVLGAFIGWGLWVGMGKLRSVFKDSSLPSPLAGEGRVRGKSDKTAHPHPTPFPSRERGKTKLKGRKVARKKR